MSHYSVQGIAGCHVCGKQATGYDKERKMVCQNHGGPDLKHLTELAKTEGQVWLDSREVADVLDRLSGIETPIYGKLVNFPEVAVIKEIDIYHLIKGMCIYIADKQGFRAHQKIINALERIKGQFEEDL